MASSTLKDEIENEINYLQNYINKAKLKLDEDFIYNFEWGYPAELFCLSFRQQQLKNILSRILETPTNAKAILEECIADITKELLDGGYTGTSTGTFHNLAHLYKKEVKAKLLVNLQHYLRWISDEKPLPIV